MNPIHQKLFEFGRFRTEHPFQRFYHEESFRFFYIKGANHRIRLPIRKGHVIERKPNCQILLRHPVDNMVAGSFQYLRKRHALCSSIMPQKKNPVSLEYSRAKASFNIGSLNSCMTVLKGIPYTNTMEIFELSPAYFASLEQTQQQLLLICETLKYAKLRRDRALKQASENLCTVTSLADYWVKKYGISFTEAHDIVGNIVAIILDSGELIAGITPELVKTESKAALGWEIEMTARELKSVLDPFENVQSKTGIGGPSIASVEAMIQNGKAQLEQQKNWLLAAKKHVTDAYRKLQAEADALK